MKILDWIINSNKWTWDYLSLNSNAIPLLEANPDKINWDMLSQNPNAISLLEVNQDKINWSNLSSNPNAIVIHPSTNIGNPLLFTNKIDLLFAFVFNISLLFDI